MKRCYEKFMGEGGRANFSFPYPSGAKCYETMVMGSHLPKMTNSRSLILHTKMLTVPSCDSNFNEINLSYELFVYLGNIPLYGCHNYPLQVYNVTCQAHPVLVKKSVNHMCGSFLLKFLSRWLSSLLIVKCPPMDGPKDPRSRVLSLPAPPRWHGTICTTLV